MAQAPFFCSVAESSNPTHAAFVLGCTFLPGRAFLSPSIIVDAAEEIKFSSARRKT